MVRYRLTVVAPADGSHKNVGEYDRFSDAAASALGCVKEIEEGSPGLVFRSLFVKESDSRPGCIRYWAQQEGTKFAVEVKEAERKGKGPDIGAGLTADPERMAADQYYTQLEASLRAAVGAPPMKPRPSL